MKKGLFYAVFAYTFWGLHPIYWKQLYYVDPLIIVSHRIFWSAVFFTLILSSRHQWPALLEKIKHSKSKISLFAPALLIGSNWLLYIWAVNNDFVIETSLGYFICPLLSVFLGVAFLKEKLTRIQWISIFIAASGILLMTILYGNFPWISLLLAATWGFYGLMRKKSKLSASEGLFLESAFLSIPAIFFLIWNGAAHEFAFGADFTTTLLLIGAGFTSGFPLLVYISAARIINLSLLGILQYIYPALIFCVGYFLYDEVLDDSKIIGFFFIGTALILFTSESIKKIKNN